MKKFTAIIICLLMVFACNLAGCASFSINKEKYYNEVLAKVGSTNITRFDLLNAYNSYGKSYFGSDESTGLNSTLDLLIERESLYQYALSEGDKFKPTPYQVNEIVKSMFESLDSQVENYVKTAKKILNIKEEVKPEEESKEDSTKYLYEDYLYKKRAEVVKDGNDYKIIYTEQPEETISEPMLENDYLSDFNKKDMISTIKSAYEKRLADKDYDADIERKIKQLLTSDLINYEKYLLDDNGKHYSKSYNDLLYRYFERNFNSQIQSQYLENIRTDYLKDPNNLDIELLLNTFKHAANTNYELYDEDDEIADYKNAIKSIGTKGDTVLYHPNMTDGTKFGYFLHTLINFSDDQKTAIKNLENEKNETKRQNEINKIVAQTTAKPRNSLTGLIDENAESISLENILSDYNKITGSYEEKLAQFIEFMFTYTGDAESTLKSGMPYVIGHNYNTKENYSDMVEEFTAEAVKLMKDEVKGTMSSFSIDNIGEMCVTEYGIHFLFYVGDVKENDILPNQYNDVYIQSDNKTDMADLNLFHKLANPITGKTYFDLLFDVVYPGSSSSIYATNTGYDKEEDRLVALIQSQDGHKVTKYITKINATKTSIK